MEVKDFVKKIKEISPRIKDIKLIRLQHEKEGYTDEYADMWIQVEDSGRWKVEFLVEEEKE